MSDEFMDLLRAYTIAVEQRAGMYAPMKALVNYVTELRSKIEELDDRLHQAEAAEDETRWRMG